jgi:hypothetical protein
MDSEIPNPRLELIRSTAVLQIKLLIDGIRDAILIPVSLVAALIGVFRGGEDCDREFRRVIKVGRRSERWINLFGHHRPLGNEPVGSMDSILDQVETAVMEKYQKNRKPSDAGSGKDGAPGTGSE